MGLTTDSGRILAGIIDAHRELSLGRYLSRLAQVSVAAGAIALAGCSSSHIGDDAGSVDGGPPPSGDAAAVDAGPPSYPDANVPISDGGSRPDAMTPEFADPPLCSSEGNWLAVHGHQLTRAPEYLDAYENGPFAGSFVIDSMGTACGTASDMAACQSALTALEGTFYRGLRTTDGDDVAAIFEEVDVLALLGAIDTPNEALLRAWLAGYDIRCGDTSRWGVSTLADGSYEVLATRLTADCDPIILTGYTLHVATDGTVTVLSMRELERTDGVCVGRRPEGLRPGRAEAPTEAARFFAEVTRLEAGAVHAFEILARELSHHGAPAALVAEARRAARDEVRHAESMGRIARGLGATVAPVEVEPRPLRALFEMALDNATEGCVRETFGAMVGHHQALAARDPEVREAMRQIAEDETRHASLSWKIDRWLLPLLTDEQRARVEEARQAAVRALRDEMRVEPDAALVAIAGLPTARIAVSLVDQMRGVLWAA